MFPLWLAIEIIFYFCLATARRSNQSILKEISPGISLEGMMLKLKLQYFGHLMWRVDSLEKTVMLRGIGGRKRRGCQRMRWLDGITDSMDVGFSGSWWWAGRPGMLRFMGLQIVGRNWATDLIWSDMCTHEPMNLQLSPRTSSLHAGALTLTNIISVSFHPTFIGFLISSPIERKRFYRDRYFRK